MQQSTPNSVLIIEDEPALISMLCEILKREALDVVRAMSCAQARSAFVPGRFACAVVDLGLPDGHGLELVSEFHAQDPNLVAIVLTGDAKVETVVDAMRAGAFDYIVKPFQVTAVRTAVNRAIEHGKLLRERDQLLDIVTREKELLRDRVEAATQDLRRHATAIEIRNAHLRALLNLTHLMQEYASEEDLLRNVFLEVAGHLPLRGIIVSDHPRGDLVAIYKQDNQIHYTGTESLVATEFDATRLPDEDLMRAWASRHEWFPTAAECHFHVHNMRNTAKIAVGLFTDEGVKQNEGAFEFLDTCSHFLAYEWERSKLLYQVAHQASLGNIAVELARGLMQPLAAIRVAADVLHEAVPDLETAQGAILIQENVERLRRQSQEFRQLATFREDAIETVRLDDYVNQALDILAVTIQTRGIEIRRTFQPNCQCTLVNGAALARTILSLLLDAVRNSGAGSVVHLAVHDLDAERIAVDIAHIEIVRAAGPTAESYSMWSRLALQLAGQTVHRCGGALHAEQEAGGRCLYRVALPRDIARLTRRDEAPTS